MDSETTTNQEVNSAMKCTLCNEHIEDTEVELGEAKKVDGEWWHMECYAEYFEEVLEEV